MSERRPHWTDDLINAVIDLQYHCVDCMEDDYPDIDPSNHDAVNAAWACEVIAVVEDWHKAKRDSRDRTHNDDCWRWHQECAEALIEAQQAAIQRVRELIDTADTFTPPLVLISAELRRALGVPCPTCSGPIRETVGLVCQTCGTDYGASDE